MPTDAYEFYAEKLRTWIAPSLSIDVYKNERTYGWLSADNGCFVDAFNVGFREGAAPLQTASTVWTRRIAKLSDRAPVSVKPVDWGGLN